MDVEQWTMMAVFQAASCRNTGVASASDECRKALLT